jgi:hypothetical protein
MKIPSRLAIVTTDFRAIDRRYYRARGHSIRRLDRFSDPAYHAAHSFRGICFAWQN